MWKVVEIWEQLHLVPCSIFKTKTMVTSFLHISPPRAARLPHPAPPDDVSDDCSRPDYHPGNLCTLHFPKSKQMQMFRFLQHLDLVVHSLTTVCVVLSESLICLFRPNGDPWRDDLFLGDIIGVCSVKLCCCHAIMSVAIITTITFYFTTWIVL